MGALKYETELLSAHSFKNAVLRDFYLAFDQNHEFDFGALHHLCSDTTEITVIRMLAHFNQNLKNGMEQIRTGLSDGRNDLIERAAHKLVGTAELIGFKAFSMQSRLLINLIRKESGQQNILEATYNYLEKCDQLFMTLETSCPSLKIHL